MALGVGIDPAAGGRDEGGANIRSGMSRLISAAAVVAVLTALLPAAPALAVGPTAAPSPRSSFGVANDTARSEVVLFGGGGLGGLLDDTWTWDGTDWTQRIPAHSPSARERMGMADDAAHGQVVLFGGSSGNFLGDTWTWDGTDWTKRTPVHSPSARHALGMAYDAARGQVVLFGGFGGGNYLGDTWTWDGTDWTQRPAGSIRLTPRSGAPGSSVQVVAWGFAAGEIVSLKFIDSTQGKTFLKRVRTDATGAFTTEVTIPLTAIQGEQHIKAKGLGSGGIAKRIFTVT
jgi:hypothetical protein